MIDVKRGLTVQLLVQSLDLPWFLDQADGFAVDVSVGLVGTIDGDACKQGRESENVVTDSDIYRGSVFVYLSQKQEIITELWP